MKNTNTASRKEECLPYSQLQKQERLDYVEPAIRNLVEVLNSFPGIETIASCEGHQSKIGVYKGLIISYVAFTSENEEYLKKILASVPEYQVTLSSGAINLTVAVSSGLSFSKEYKDQILYRICLRSSDKLILHYLNDKLAKAIQSGEKLEIDFKECEKIVGESAPPAHEKVYVKHSHDDPWQIAFSSGKLTDGGSDLLCFANQKTNGSVYEAYPIWLTNDPFRRNPPLTRLKITDPLI